MVVNTIQENVQFILSVGDHSQREGGLRTQGNFKKSEENQPLISIITVVYNGEKYLEETIKSVFNQTYHNVEYIIIDGGSTDKTLDIIKKYEDKIDYWVSEKDSGIYDAMNKGLLLARGDFLGIINSDDWYVNNTMELIIKYSQDNKRVLLFGDMIAHMREGYDIYHSAFLPTCKEDIKISRVHPTVFISKDAYQAVGVFDISYRVAADFDLMIRMYLNNIQMIKINQLLVHFRDGGVSAEGLGGLEEFYIAKKHHFKKIIIVKILFSILFVKIKIYLKKKFPVLKQIYKKYFIVN